MPLKGFRGIPYNTAKLYVKHTLYNGCLLYIPINKQEEAPKVKLLLNGFNNWQIEQFKPEPESA